MDKTSGLVSQPLFVHTSSANLAQVNREHKKVTLVLKKPLLHWIFPISKGMVRTFGLPLDIRLPWTFACPGHSPALDIRLPWTFACPGHSPALDIRLP